MSNESKSNTTNGNGAGIHIDRGTLTVSSSLFKRNTATIDGGGIWTSVASTVSQSTFQNNLAGGNGGGIEQNMVRNPLSVDLSVFRSNKARFGGAIDNQTGDITITRSQFARNSATGGGVMNNEGGTLHISSSTFYHKTATTDRDGGGALWMSIPTTIVNSTFSHNRSLTGPGGAIDNDDNLLTLLTVTFVGNMARRGEM